MKQDLQDETDATKFFGKKRMVVLISRFTSVALYSLVTTTISHEMCMIFLKVLPLCISRFLVIVHNIYLTTLHCNSVLKCH